MNTLQGLNALYPSLVNGPSSVLSGDLKEATASKADGANFTGQLTQALQALETKQAESNEAVQGLMAGTADDMHTVMIKTTEAQLSLELAVQMRNKVLEAYNEIKNIQF